MPAEPTKTDNSAPGHPALLVDGSALFFGQRDVSPDRNLDYLELDASLRRHGHDQWPARPAYFFTAADQSNEKQTKFHQMIHNELGWAVRQIAVPEAITGNALLSDQNTRIIRFDALISYALGRLAGSAATSRVFIISDSWPLSAPVKDCVARGTPVTMCFFGSNIDSRWHKVFREADPSQIDFLDFETNPRLFNRPRLPRRKEDDMLADLP
jgi:hypothetical protein